MLKNFTMKTGACWLVLLAFMAIPAFAQKAKKDDKKPAVTTPVKTDTVKAKPANGMKPYKQVITAKAKTQKGLFTVHKLNDDYFFEIPDSVIGREFMAVTRNSKTATGAGYGGEEENRQVLRWERGPNRLPRADSSLGRAVRSSRSRHRSNAIP